MNTENRLFIYQDAKGNVTSREVVNISDTDEYIQGICLKSNALRTFRKDRILENITDISSMDEKLKYHQANAPRPKNSSCYSSRSRNTTGKPEVCFTGFKKAEKDKLVEVAKLSEMFIRSSVTKNLDFLCCGYNAGPKKIEKARHQGVIALSEKQFRTMLETGEVPEEA